MTPMRSKTYLWLTLFTVCSMPLATFTSSRALGQDSGAQAADLPKGLHVTSIVVGFDGGAILDNWTPISIDVQSVGVEFQGTLTITTADPDGTPVSMTLENVSIPLNRQQTIRHYIRVSSQSPSVELDFLTAGGEHAYRRQFEPGRILLADIRDNASTLILGIGNPGGLLTLNKLTEEEDDSSAELMQQQMFEAIRVTSAETLPTQWLAYGNIGAIVMSTDDRVLGSIDPLRASAIQTWVRQGGHLVVSVGTHWQVASQSFLGSMLPARIEGLQTVGKLSPEVRWLESMAGGKSALPVGDAGMQILRLSSVDGTILPPDIHEAASNPFIVRGTYGFGTVTLLGFDIDSPPFLSWNVHRDFWMRLLNLNAAPGRDEQELWSQSWSRPDLSHWIDNQINNFPEVAVVSFSWVAILIVGYILLIGPIDYFFLKKVVGRLELTWITFPMIVLVVSVAAYFTANWLKGDQLRLNRIELVDVDQDGTLRGKEFLSIFSPIVSRYTITTEPALAADGTWADLGMGRAPLDRWTACIGSLAQNFNRNTNQGLFGSGGYEFSSPEPVAVVDAPIRVWSVKSFTSSWLARGRQVIENDLQVGDLLVDQTGLVGSIRNTLGTPILGAVLIWGEYAFELGTLNPDETITLSLEHQRPLTNYLNRNNDVQNGINTYMYENPSDGVFNNARSFIINLTYSDRQKVGATSLSNSVMSQWGMKSLIDTGKAVLVGTVEKPGGNLWINEPPVAGKSPSPLRGIERRITFLRVVLEPKTND